MFSQSRGEPHNVVRNVMTDFLTILFDLVHKKNWYYAGFSLISP